MKLMPEKIMWKSGIASAFVAAIMAPTIMETREEFVERVSHSHAQDVVEAQAKYNALTSGSEKARMEDECRRTANNAGIVAPLMFKNFGGRENYMARCMNLKMSEETREAGFWLSAYKARQEDLLKDPASQHEITATFARTVGGVAGGLALFCLGAPLLRRRRSGDDTPKGPTPTVY